MLGCHDFCGHYEWTFHYLRRRFGYQAVAELMGPLGLDAHAHYLKAGKEAGLAGLYQTWVQTGDDEQCDWTFTLNEEKNILRWDMRKCPSRGFLLDNDLNQDEDYCDHCMGWIVPLLDEVGAEVTEHEHNHRGQCWAEMSMKGKPYQPLDLPIDIRKSPDWQQGYIERWERNRKLPVLDPQRSSVDPCDILKNWFRDYASLTVLGRGPSATDSWGKSLPLDGVLLTDPSYVNKDVFDGEPAAVLFGDHPSNLDAFATRFHATEPNRRPLLMHMYLPVPGGKSTRFGDYDLPRPVPLLPLLIRQGLYRHTPNAPYPTTGVFLVLLGVALGKDVHVGGIDLYETPEGEPRRLPGDGDDWPVRHSRKCDLQHLQQALKASFRPLHLAPHLVEKMQ